MSSAGEVLGGAEGMAVNNGRYAKRQWKWLCIAGLSASIGGAAFVLFIAPFLWEFISIENPHYFHSKFVDFMMLWVLGPLAGWIFAASEWIMGSFGLRAPGDFLPVIIPFFLIAAAIQWIGVWWIGNILRRKLGGAGQGSALLLLVVFNCLCLFLWKSFVWF